MIPDLTKARATVCRYKCGDCGHESVNTWKIHQMHHSFHELQKLSDELGDYS